MTSSLGLSSNLGALDKASSILSSLSIGLCLTIDIEVELTSPTSSTLSTQLNYLPTSLAI